MISKYKTSNDPGLIRRLRAAGCPVPGNEVEELQPDLTVEVINPLVTIAYDLRIGAEYVFSIRITNDCYRPLIIEEVRVRMPWLAHLTWLGDPGKFSSNPYYRLLSGRTFSYSDVINRLVWGDAEIGPGASFEGLLLAYSYVAHVPVEFIHHDTVPVKIFLIDQFGREHCSEIETTVDRSATMRPGVHKKRRTSLYEEEESSQMGIGESEAEDSHVQAPLFQESERDSEPGATPATDVIASGPGDSAPVCSSDALCVHSAHLRSFQSR